MKTYILTNDDIVEVLYNDMLKDRPYLLRFYNYDNETYEIRMNKQDIDVFIGILNKILEV
jgi:hypothetical protein